MKTKHRLLLAVAFCAVSIAVNNASAQDWIQSTQTSAPSSADWYSVASSADGSKLVVVSGGNRGPIFTSTNTGATWTSNNLPLISGGWSFVASSANGNKLVAVADYGGGIYTWQAAPPPTLSLALTGTAAFIAWPTNATGFVVEQNVDLATTNWLEVTNAPTITNQQNQLILPPGNGSIFYRLHQP